MAAALPHGRLTVFAVSRGRMVSGSSGFTFGAARLPTDSVGTFVLTVQNVVVGSSIRVEVQSTGQEIETRTATTANEVFNIPAYTSGNPLNSLRIKVRKGTSAPKYLPFDTYATAVVGSGNVYILQTQDTIAM